MLAAVALLTSPAATSGYVAPLPELARWLDVIGNHLPTMCCLLSFWRLLLRGSRLWVSHSLVALSDAAVLLCLSRILAGPLEPKSHRFAAQFAAMVAVTVLVSPHVLSYDLTLLLIPIVLLAGVRARGAALLLWAGASFNTLLARMGSLQVGVIAMVMVTVWLARTTHVTPCPSSRGAGWPGPQRPSGSGRGPSGGAVGGGTADR